MSNSNHNSASRAQYLSIFLGCLILLVFTTGAIFAEGGGIVNSPHDFSNLGQSANSRNTTGELCVACHVPHDFGQDIYQSGLLWNHAPSEATYTTYVSSAGLSAQQPSGTSKLCLGCHDGTIAIDDYDGASGGGSAFIGDYNSAFQVPGRLTQHNNSGRTHPVGIEYIYDPFDADGLHSPSSPLGFSGSINDVLDNGKVVCSSCHDVHNNGAQRGSQLLRAPMKASQGSASGLCLSCHKK